MKKSLRPSIPPRGSRPKSKSGREPRVQAAGRLPYVDVYNSSLSLGAEEEDVVCHNIDCIEMVRFRLHGSTATTVAHI